MSDLPDKLRDAADKLEEHVRERRRAAEVLSDLLAWVIEHPPE
jgi:hypothetical protein